MAQKFLGLEFDRQTILLAGGALIGAVALSSLFRSKVPLQAVAAAAPFPIDLFASGLLQATETGARAASTGIDAGSRIAVAGIGSGTRIAERGLDLADVVTGSIARIAERQSDVLGDVTERTIGALERITTTAAPRVAAPAAAVGAPVVPRDEPPALPAPARAIVAPPTPTLTLDAETSQRIEREFAARGETLEQHQAKVNIPALFNAPGVVVTAEDRALVAAGRTPRAVRADGRLIY